MVVLEGRGEVGTPLGRADKVRAILILALDQDEESRKKDADCAHTDKQDKDTQEVTTINIDPRPQMTHFIKP